MGRRHKSRALPAEYKGQGVPTRAAQPAVSPRRAYCEVILAEEPPEEPWAPYSPEPPAWMREPVPLLDPRNQQPLYWTDEAPRKAWEHRQGRAVYDLMQEDLRDQLRAEAEAQNSPGNAWARKQAERERKVIASKMQAVINHPARLLTVKQRVERKLTAPWNRQPKPVPAEEVLPEAEMCWAPWHLEGRP
ncbi:hypothetical protein [Streptomyces sp. IMTB 1903]|uniref:hypothetical protein n=1 Tax=Streptomyces sp. IMTB 1903 TaxID=1776680 RepID=UPI000756783D|nr:hypothetical protein [Streptomyces sp. IMTB 1903]